MCGDPPNPLRYLLSRCCNDVSHCINASGKDFVRFHTTKKLPDKASGLLWSHRLQSLGLLLPDHMCSHGKHSCTDRSAKKKVTARDGFHFTVGGYRNMAERIAGCLWKLMLKPKKAVKPQAFF
jgi:hypothetical protein